LAAAMNDSTAGADPLDQLLRGEYPDPDGGAPIAIPVKAIHIENSLRGLEADIVRPLGLGRKLAVVSDPATHAALGARIEKALAAMATIVPLRLDAQPQPDVPTVAALRQACEPADAIVAVGSGTINDLCKYAAAQDGKPYAVFATAPSMNGYTSVNAAITVDGHKRTLAANTPVGVFIDLEVFASAPPRMIRAGLGDSLCRPTAQADWLLSHHLLGTPYRSAPFAMLAQDEPRLFDSSEALMAGDLDAMRALARTLVLSGLGMTVCNGSYPASQGEHLISHYIDMYSPVGRGDYFHGEQVAVATLTMARIQQELLAEGPPILKPSPVTEADLVHRLGAEVGPSCWREFLPKRAVAQAASTLSKRASDAWSDLKARIGAASIAAERLAAIMTRAEGPRTAKDIGLAPAFYAGAVRNARFLRDRYTFLDLADDSGYLARWWPA
jgi:glycerol-1-phosphate dehydrogenase [NAD(P)+]